MRKKRGVVFALFFAVLLVSSMGVLASFDEGDDVSDIDDVYGPEANLRGWINISLDSEPANSELAVDFDGTDFDQEMKLIDFLDLNDADYDCDPDDCESDYSVSGGGETSKVFNVDIDEEKIIGLKLTGDIDNINLFSIKIASDAGDSEKAQIKVDILNDDSIEWQAHDSSGSFGSTDYGCYDSGDSSDSTDITSTEFCGKIRLAESSGVRIGADVNADTGGDVDFEMQIYDEDNDYYSEDCTASASSSGEIYCDIDEPIREEDDFYVCINVYDDDDEGNYEIDYEDDDACGFSGEHEHDFAIFARTEEFDSFGSVVLDDDELIDYGSDIIDIESYIADYIYDRYSNDCSDDCIVPVRLISGIDQDITISDVNFEYEEGGLTKDSDLAYETDEIPADIDMDFRRLSLDDANFSVPDDYGDDNLRIELDGSEILEMDIEIVRVPVVESLSPRNAPAGGSTRFVATVSGGNVTSYTWDFGDGDDEVTSVNYVNHVYEEIDDYTLIIEVENNLGTSSKSFGISVVSPKNYVNTTIEEYRIRFDNISSQIEAMPVWYKSNVESAVNVDDMEIILNDLESDYDNAADDDDYVDIMTALTDMNVPYSVEVGAEGKVPYFVDVGEVSASQISEAGAGSYPENEDSGYETAVAAWAKEKLDIEVDIEYVSGYYDSGVENIISIYELEIDPKQSISGQVYVVIEGEDIVFSQSYNTKDVTGGVGVVLSDLKTTKRIKFAVSEVEIDQLAVSVSPEFSILSIEGVIGPCNFNDRCEPDFGETWRNCRADCKPWGWVTIMLIILLFAAVVAYILMQWWYKVKYEGYLFKDRRQIYNLMNFVSNARSQGLKDREIAVKLKKAGWKGEQIRYIFRKMRGKAIMPLDFLKLFKKGGVQKAVQELKEPAAAKHSVKHGVHNVHNIHNLHNKHEMHKIGHNSR